MGVSGSGSGEKKVVKQNLLKRNEAENGKVLIWTMSTWKKSLKDLLLQCQRPFDVYNSSHARHIRAFSTPSTLTLSTLLGSITQYQIRQDNDAFQLAKIFEGQTEDISKVNALLIDSDERRVVMAGLTKDGKGKIEIWNKEGAL